MRLLYAAAFSAATVLAATSAPQSVTFNKDVLPVLEQNCQTCHRPGEAAPMSFLTYQQTRPWAKAMKTAVLTKKMPPWFADPQYGHFANDRTLPQSAIDTLVAWADNGAKEGDPKDAPKPVEWVEGWRIGQPEMIVEMPQAFHVPASGTIDYQYIVIPLNLKKDMYVQMAEARPGDPKVVHHIIAFIREPGNPWMRDVKPGVPFAPKEQEEKHDESGAKDKGHHGDAAGFGGDFLAGYAPGITPETMRPGQVKLLKAGSDVILQMHYTATGKESDDKSRIGLIFAKEPPTERVLTLAAATGDINIPPGDPNYRLDAKIQLQRDTKLVALLPHMHFRGKSFEYVAVYPTGERETLLDVPKYDFNWQLWYQLADQKVLPKGTVIECTAHYDNSANNRFNPDPTKMVHYGEQTWEEMMFGFFDVAVPMDTTAMDLMRPPKKHGDAASGSE